MCVSASPFRLKHFMFHWVGCLTENMGRFCIGNGFRNFDDHLGMAIRRFRTAGIATCLRKLHLLIFGFCILARLHLYMFVDGIVDVCRRSPGFHWKKVFRKWENSSGCHSASDHRVSKATRQETTPLVATIPRSLSNLLDRRFFPTGPSHQTHFPTTTGLRPETHDEFPVATLAAQGNHSWSLSG